MRKTPKTASEDLWFVRKYCFARKYPANDGNCCYIRAKIMFKSSEISTDSSDFKDLDAVFLCRYPDERMPLHEARLTSELDQCPNTERRKMIDAQYAGEA
jgi:hypothetical protein